MDEVAELLGVGVASAEDLGVSHEWSLHRVGLSDGRTVFVKRQLRQGNGTLAAEASGLRWLGEAEGAPVVPVFAGDDRMLVLPWIAEESPSDAAADRFGAELAAMHVAGAPSFGAPWAGYIAELPLDNTERDEWAGFYAEQRLLPYLNGLDGEGVRLVRRVVDEIDRLAGPAEPPSRIHGDLWSGNLLWSGGRGVLIDPAAHGGHRETDLAMLALFGAPRLDRILAAYNRVAPLAEGWQERVALHQLHPLMVHAVLFGGSYQQAVVRAARQALKA